MENEKSEYIITSDCIFEPAQKPHKVCQDYALCGNDPFPFLIISDGCGSSENTDIGSRILSHSAKANLDQKLECVEIVFPIDVIFDAKKSIEKLKIDQTCLDATLIVSYILENQINILMCGDGHIFGVNKKGEIDFHQTISYKNNAPYYLSYFLNQKRELSYKKSQNDIFGTILTEINGKKLSFENIICRSKLISLPINDFESLFITSDGIESFFNMKTGEAISYTEIIKEIISIKSKTGSFIKRRIGRMFKDLSEKGIYNSDDISVASFLIKKRDNFNG